MADWIVKVPAQTDVDKLTAVFSAINCTLGPELDSFSQDKHGPVKTFRVEGDDNLANRPLPANVLEIFPFSEIRIGQR